MSLLKRLHKRWHWMPLNIRFIFAGTLISAGAVLAFAVLYWYYQVPFLTFSFLAVFPIHFAILCLVLKQQKYTLPSWLILSTITVLVGLAVGKVGGTEGPVLYWLAIIPLSGGLLLQKKGIVGGSIFSASVFLTIALAERFTELPTYQVRLGHGYDLASFFLFLGCVIFSTLEYVRNNRAVYGQESRKLHSLLAIVTHDLASPLTLLLFSAKKMTLDESQSISAQESAQKMYQAASMMKTLIDKVRKIKALQSGKLLTIEADMSATLALAFTEVRDLFEGKLLAKNQALILDLPDSIRDLPLHVDPDLLLHDVLGNLLSNAIKFSPVTAHITIKAERTGSSVTITVSDKGLGIPAEILPFIFDDSVATNRRGTNGEKGTGFGLPLVQYIVVSWGGKLEVETATEGQALGSTFRFTLPIAKAPKGWDQPVHHAA
ncbi:MAG: HAMP domain-containing histidine kinase [Chitinophagaceae bacterium]|nr:HAMP domain-containing histidine kinase [Oligoflexus sp.]